MFMLEIARATFMNSYASHTSYKRTFSFEPALIGSREMETTRSHMRWMKHVSKVCIRSLSVTRTARLSGLCWNFRRITILPPIGKQRRYPALSLTIIHAVEQGLPKARKRIEWKLITNLPVTSRRQAIEKLDWYALRWKIEVFHKILKSGCKAEESKL